LSSVRRLVERVCQALRDDSLDLGLLAIPWCGAPVLDEKGVDKFMLHSPISRVAATPPGRRLGIGRLGLVNPAFWGWWHEPLGTWLLIPVRSHFLDPPKAARPAEFAPLLRRVEQPRQLGL
jgi:hypothetical protein